MRSAELLFYTALSAWQFLKYQVWKPNLDKQIQARDSYTPPGFKNYDSLLQSKNPFYAGLSQMGKVVFVSRLREIRDEIEIQGREGFEVTDEVRVLVCGCIAQLTYGYDEPHMPFLEGVVIYPQAFYSRLAENWVKGLAMGNGVVFLSWADFEEGYHFSTSTYNLGLHEFAHMLRLQALKGSGFDPRLEHYFTEWEANGMEVFKQIRTGHEDFFREYAGANTAEFFSVCVENFFEVPQKFSEELPEVYWSLCHLLKQNPLNTKHDYAFSPKDAAHVNQFIAGEVNPAHPYILDWERVLEPVTSFLGIMSLILMFIIWRASDETSAFFISWFRTMLVSLGIVLFARFSHFKRQEAFVSQDNLKYTAAILIPTLSFLILLFEFVFTFILEV